MSKLYTQTHIQARRHILIIGLLTFRENDWKGNLGQIVLNECVISDLSKGERKKSKTKTKIKIKKDRINDFKIINYLFFVVIVLW